MAIKIVNWTYTRNPSIPRDAVRLLVGDTNPDDKQLDDDEIAWLLQDNGGPVNAAIAAAIGLAAMYSRKYDNSTSDTDSAENKKTASKGEASLSEHYLQVADKLLMQRSRRGVSPYAGGLSIAEKVSNDQDQDRVRPFFRRDLMDYNAVLDDLKSWWGWY